MKALYISVLTVLIISPTLWNSIGLLHLLTNHSHEIVKSEQTIIHTDNEHCSTFCEMLQEHSHDGPNTTEIVIVEEFHEFLITMYPRTATVASTLPSDPFTEVHSLDRLIHEEIFHPPTS